MIRIRRRTRRRLQLAALAVAAGALYARGWHPDLEVLLRPVEGYVHSDAWRAPVALVVAVITAWAGWRIRWRPRRRPATLPERTALYRWYDHEARLLYVGISNQPVRRAREHHGHQPWWTEVRSATVEWFDTRGQALEAEERAIKRELPEWNIVHGRRR